MSSDSSDSVSAVLRVRDVAGAEGDDDGGGPSWYEDEQSGMMVDSPVSAADMLSRSLQQGYLRRRMEASRRRSTLGAGERQDASASFAQRPPQTSRRPSRRPSSPPVPAPPASGPRQSLFPDISRAQVNEGHGDFISPPTARNNPDAADERRRRRRSTARSSFAAPNYDDDDDDDDDDKDDPQTSRVSRRAPLASTPFHASTMATRQTARRDDSTPTQARAADTLADLFASSAARRSQANQRQSVLASRPNEASFASSSHSSSNAPRAANAFARWGGGVEESPMDLLRRLAAAPGFAATATPSDQGRDGNESRQSSALRPGSTRAADRRRSILATPRNAAEQSAYSDAGQGRRQGYGMSSPGRQGGQDGDESVAARSMLSATDGGRSRLGGRPSSVRFADVAPLEFVVEGAKDDDEEEEQELEDMLLQAPGNATGREGFVLDPDDEGDQTGDGSFAYEVERQSGSSDGPRAIAAAGVFDGLADDDEESAPESFQSAQQVSGEAEEQGYSESDGINDDYGGGDDVERDNPAAAFEDDVQEYDGGFDNDDDITVRNQRVFDDTAATQRPIPDDDEEEDYRNLTIAVSEVNSEVRRREDAARMQLLMKRTRKRQSDRTSAATGATVVTMPPRLTHELFRTMITPSLGIGSVAAPGKKRARPRIALDKLALEGVDTVAHHFLNQFVGRLSARAEARRGRPRRRRSGGEARMANEAIDESDVLALLHEDGTLNERMSLVSLARKYLPREMSDELPAEMELLASALYENEGQKKTKKRTRKSTGKRHRYLDDSDDDVDEVASGASLSSEGKGRKRRKKAAAPKTDKAVLVRRGGGSSLADDPRKRLSTAEQAAEARRLHAQARRYGVEKQTRSVWQRGVVGTARAAAAASTYDDDDDDDDDDDEAEETGESEEMDSYDRDAELEARTGESIEGASEGEYGSEE